ncbi:LutB/LldF family L-lactate oxidation iron-sulfur protein [Marinimicrobium sp. C6131]|uniref:LutB/LldF family L-lactate oxidation iron-sulfur protein n=1 Tax=Marinimicrobium sp. C6131 TaxID=3022676 RepID=UPI00223E50CA|nr:LutB/LldF family L-lactate oxidation iron-sulfur protein [Marinimicrobium sp. C6131]UZJ44949.1 LutB/LldF family L-lactate oxidation iron-sulfur protein [Marinimicrobium sp. C6131]
MSGVEIQEPDFIARSRGALDDDNLQQALEKAGSGFVHKRQAAIERVPNFEAMRDRALRARQRALKNLDVYLLHFEKKVQEAGGQVHWVETPEQMRETVVGLCRQYEAKTVTKGKSMVGEEVELNEALEEAGIEPQETDLGEYVIQLAHERPSHIVAPALHKTKAQVQALFRENHPLGERDLDAVESIVNEARDVIRERFLQADVGITGANMLIAETGTAAIVTNEGNGDLTATLPKTHIVTTSIDKVIPTWKDASAILRVLARSATGQDITTYTTFFTGPKGAQDKDGPENFHIVLMDNRRTEILGTEFQDMLHCIRCGACMNHCPVYQSVGGHTYNSVYPGPMGAVLTPLLRHGKDDYQLPNASTFCGRCESVCPVRIPLPGLMRKLRDKEQREATKPKASTLAVRLFCRLSRRPGLYRHLTSPAVKVMRWLAGNRGRFRSLPMMSSWTRYRDFSAPQGSSFQTQWRQQPQRQSHPENRRHG